MMRANVLDPPGGASGGHTHDPSRETSSFEEAEGATAPETLRQKDREGDELLESRLASAILTEGVIRLALPSGEISQVR
jgi:hypothetical protein